jgi:hypothetical protein
MRENNKRIQLCVAHLRILAIKDLSHEIQVASDRRGTHLSKVVAHVLGT